MTGWSEPQLSIISNLMEIEGVNTGTKMFRYMVNNFRPEYEIIMDRGSDVIGRKMRHLKTKRDEKTRTINAKAKYYEQLEAGEPDNPAPEPDNPAPEPDNPGPEPAQIEQHDLGMASGFDKGKASSNNETGHAETENGQIEQHDLGVESGFDKGEASSNNETDKMTGWSEPQLSIISHLMEIEGVNTGTKMFEYMENNFRPEYEIIMDRGSDVIGRKMRHLKTQKDEKTRTINAKAKYYEQLEAGEPDNRAPEPDDPAPEPDNPGPEPAQIEQHDLGVTSGFDKGEASSNNETGHAETENGQIEQHDLGVASGFDKGEASSNNETGHTQNQTIHLNEDLGVDSNKRNGAPALNERNVNAVKKDVINFVQDNFGDIGAKNNIPDGPMGDFSAEIIKYISNYQFI